MVSYSCFDCGRNFQALMDAKEVIAKKMQGKCRLEILELLLFLVMYIISN